MLLISRSMELWKILMFDWWTIVSIFLDLQLSPLAPNIFFCFSIHQEMCSSSSYSSHFRHLFFSDIMMEAISSQNMTNPNWLFYAGYYLEVSSSLLYVQELFHRLFSLAILSSHSPPAPHFKESMNKQIIKNLGFQVLIERF
jgi:hypothetical protein